MLTRFLLMGFVTQAAFGQLTQEQVREQAVPAVAMVLASRGTTSTPVSGVAVAVSSTGVLLTPLAFLKDAYAVQVRFSNGEVFDDVQMLGVDERRGVAAIKVSGAFKVRPVVLSDVPMAGDAVTFVTHPGGAPWSAFTGSYRNLRMADEIPGAGSGFKVIQFTASGIGGTNGGAVVFDSQARVLAIVTGSTTGDGTNIAVPADSVAGLTNAAVSRRFSSGAYIAPPVGVRGGTPRLAPQTSFQSAPATSPGAPERSDALFSSKDKDFVLRNFKTMFVDARNAKYFEAAQLKAQFGRNKDFAKLGITIVDDRSLADAVLEVSYTFAWDFPFVLKHQNSSMVLLSGKGVGPMSGVLGAADVAKEFTKAAKPFRQIPQKKK